MPCYDAQGAESDRISRAALCGILRAFPSLDFSLVDWKETGITKEQFLAWKKEHDEWDKYLKSHQR